MRARAILSWGARILAGAVGVVVVTAAAGYGFSEARMARHFTVPEHPITLRGDSAEIARGKHLATFRGCVDCHGTDLGGTMLLDDPAIERLAAPNLTPTGIAHYTEADFTRILRTGNRPDGSAVDPVMPWRLYQSMTETEIKAVYAYSKTVKPMEYGNR